MQFFLKVWVRLHVEMQTALPGSFELKRNMAPDAKSAEELPDYIPKFMPKFPPVHTYQQTPVYSNREEDPQLLRATRLKLSNFAESSMLKLKENTVSHNK